MTHSSIDPRIIQRFKKETSLELEPGLLMLCYVGSLSHGTHVPSTDPDAVDDVDLMGIFIPPLNYTLGLGKWEHCVFMEGELDVVFYSLHKYFTLLLKSNPNVMGTLWLDKKDYLYTAKQFEWILDGRTQFSSLSIYDSFVGYAESQLRKMLAPQRYEGYMGQKRVEFLEQGTVQVHRFDAEELIAIKKGDWKIQEIEKEAERLFARAKELKDQNPQQLLRFPNYNFADALIQSIHLSFYGLKSDI